MDAHSKEERAAAGAEQRLQELGIELPAPPAPFGTASLPLGTPVELELIFEVL